MKKSEIYKKAQMSVLHDGRLQDSDALEILRVLMSEEDVAKLLEEKEESYRGAENV